MMSDDAGCRLSRVDYYYILQLFNIEYDRLCSALKYFHKKMVITNCQDKSSLD